jgi:hypothetical protein
MLHISGALFFSVDAQESVNSVFRILALEFSQTDGMESHGTLIFTNTMYLR